VRREEIERAADALLAVSCADEGERAEIARAVRTAVEAIVDDAERLERTHSLMQLLQLCVPAVSWVRRRSYESLRAADLAGWSHGKTAKRLKVDRSAAAAILRVPRHPPEG
jgi:hypothetical protein